MLVLLLGMPIVYWNFPSQPTNSWEVLHKFRFDGDVCDDLLKGREGVIYVVPEGVGNVSIADIAKRFNLEVGKVCAHSGRPPSCGSTSLGVGEELPLPLALDRHSTAAAVDP